MTLLEKFKGTLTAQNVFLDENTGGKGKYFKARFLQPGLVKYSFGVCVLEKDTIDKFINGFVGCPVIIGHKDVTSENAKELSCGNICHIWYDDLDGWYWGDGIIDNDEALELINQGYNVSCQYEITEFANNTTNALHNGNPYDKVILNGKPEHLAIVDRPRYENAMIAVNALDLTEESEQTEEVEQTEEIEETSKTKESIIDNVLQAINEIKETDMFKKLFNRKEQQMEKDEMKSLFIECLNECLQAKNEEDKEDDKKDEKEEDLKKEEAENKCKNEVVDKRDIIRQIMAIAGKEEASEDVKTIAKLAEKLAYDKSEADDKADNEEEDEKKKEEAKNKAKNSIEEMKAMFSQTEVKKASSNYITRDDAIALGNELF